MALHEERSEQKQRKWLSRLARERRDLSASVEAALLDTALQEQRGSGEVGEQESSVQPAQGTTLIPPRLSLQSRLMTAIQPGGFVEAATRAHSAAIPAKIEEEAKESSLSATAQNANVLVRFAQRITASLAAFGTTMHPEVFPSYLIADQEEQQPLERPSPELLAVSQQQTPGMLATPLEQSQDSAPGSADPVTNGPSRVIQPVQSKQSLAGRTRKIRLETTVLPIPPQSIGQQEVQPLLEKRRGATSADLMAVSVSLAEVNATSARLPAMGNLGEISGARGRIPGEMTGGTKGTTSVHLPVLDKYKGEVGAAARGALSGSGTVECGQQEIIVANKCVTMSSIVLVMLTNDPGPVVVQYITLQPQVGFTIHLTAPAAMKASFNYVVLLGELF
jgi:hypothetical protein